MASRFDEPKTHSHDESSTDGTRDLSFISENAVSVNMKTDLTKVRSVLSGLNSAVHEDEEHFFDQLEATQMQLEASESSIAKLRRSLQTAEETKTCNEALTKSLEEARALINRLRDESEAKVNELGVIVKEQTEELERLHRELEGKTDSALYIDVVSTMEAKSTELEQLKKEHKLAIESLAAKTEELIKIQNELNESLSTKDSELARVKAEMESLQAEFDVVQAEKDEIEQGHEDAKEKWKRLVITMKSEYDNFRASFDNLKASKKEMEATHAVEKQGLQEETAKLQTQNATLSKSLDSLKISKEVMDIEYREARATWVAEKGAVDKEAAELRDSLEELQETKKAVDEKLKNLETSMDARINETLAESEKMVTAIDQECTILRSEVSSLKSASEVAAREIQELRTAYEAKVEESQKLQAEIDSLQAAVEEAEKIGTELLSENERQFNELENLKVEHSSIIKEKCRTDEKIVELEEKVENLKDTETKLATLQDKYNILQTELNTAQTSLSVAKEYHKDERKELEKKVAKLTKTVETKSEALSMALAKYLKELKAKESAEQEILEVKALAEQEKLDLIKQKDAEYQEKVKNAEASMEEERQALADIIKQKDAEYQEKVKNAEASMEEERQALTDIIKYKDEEHATALKHFTEKMEQEVKYEAEQREAALQAQVAAEAKLEDMEKIVWKKEAEMLSAKCQADSLRECLDKAESGRQDAVAKWQELSQNLEETRTSLETTKAERDQLQSRLVASEGAKQYAEKKLEEDNAESKEQINTLNKSIAKKIAIITSLESRCEKLQDFLEVNKSAEADALQKIEYLQQSVTSRDKELELIKSRCENMRVVLKTSEEEREKLSGVQQELDLFKTKLSETTILLQKKNSELRAAFERCEGMNASMQKAEALYKDGVESIKCETEKKYREALEEAQDRAYVLNQLLAQKDAEMASMKSLYDDMKATNPNDEVSGDNSLSNQIKFLDEMVASKDSELKLMKTRCESLQASIEKLRKSHEKQIDLLKEESNSRASAEAADNRAKLDSLNMEIAKKQAMLKALHSGEQDFEVILDNGENNHYLRDEVNNLRQRCGDLELALKTAEEHVAVGADGHLRSRCDALEESLAVMKQKYEDECERRKEAEQVFLSISENPSKDESLKRPHRRTYFGRHKSPELRDAASTKKTNRWLSIRGRKSTDEQRDSVEALPQRGNQDFSFSTRVAFGTSPEAILSQIPTHIKTNFMEVGFYKQRLRNNYLPVLCLGPFDVPPGRIREEWLSKFNKSGKVLNMGVYFFGRDNEGEDAYDTIPWFSFVPYAKAVQRGLHVVPQSIADKVEKGIELSEEERQIFDGIHAITVSAGLNKEQRMHPLKQLITDDGAAEPKSKSKHSQQEPAAEDEVGYNVSSNEYGIAGSEEMAILVE